MFRFLFVVVVLWSFQAEAVEFRCLHSERAGKRAGEEFHYGPDGRYSWRTWNGHIVKWKQFPIKWYTSTGFPPEKQDVVRWAFEEWERKTGVEFEYKGGFSERRFPKDDGFSTVFMAFLNHAGETRIWAWENGEIYDVDVAISPEIIYHNEEWVFRTALLHEIGHVLGLQHVSDRSSLMYPTFSGDDGEKGIDPGSLEGVRFLYGNPTEPTSRPYAGDPWHRQADFNKDRIVNFQDFVFFTRVFQTSNRQADFDGDGQVGFQDFIIFSWYFGRRY